MLLLIGCGSSSTPTAVSAPVQAQSPVWQDAPLMTHPITSSGCGKPAEIAPGTDALQILNSGGIDRSYLLHIPTGYKTSQEQALVLNFHGHNSNSVKQQAQTEFSRLADRYGVIVGYPQGVVGPDYHTGWATGPLRNPQVNDVLFVNDLLNHLQSTYCIDSHRIYATGFSNGGGMTNMLACKLAARFAAFAPVSGAYPAVPQGCDPARPVPILEIHGTADKVVPYQGSILKGYPPVEQWLNAWVKRDGCHTVPDIFMRVGDVLGERWSGCSDGVTITHYEIRGMGHTWPVHLVARIRGKGKPSTFNATSVIWGFFQDNPLPADKHASEVTAKHAGGTTLLRSGLHGLG